jgi:hypothetical protein
MTTRRWVIAVLLVSLAFWYYRVLMWAIEDRARREAR